MVICIFWELFQTGVYCYDRAFPTDGTMRVKAKDYGNNAIQFSGEMTVKVNINNTIKSHTSLVVNNNLSSLIVRDLCEKYDLCIKMREEPTFD